MWERELIFQCYRELARRERGAARQAAEELFTLNRGALRQAGIGLPAAIHFDFGDEAASLEASSANAGGGANVVKAARTLRGALHKAGFWQTKDAARFRLNITVNGSPASGYTVYGELLDTAGGSPLRRALPLRSFSRADIYDFARAFGNAVFKVD